MERGGSSPLRPYLSLFLLLKDDDSVKLEMLREMVRSINMESVPAEDILSDDPYFYSREEDRIRVA